MLVVLLFRRHFASRLSFAVGRGRANDDHVHGTLSLPPP